eukprot:g10450.t1
MVRQEGLVESLRRELQARELRVSEEQDRSSSLLKAEQDCRRLVRQALPAEEYVVRHMVSTPGVHAAMAPAAASTADEEEEGREELRVKLWSPSSGRECQDFLFGVPARRMSASTVAWLRGSETG